MAADYGAIGWREVWKAGWYWRVESARFFQAGTQVRQRSHSFHGHIFRLGKGMADLAGETLQSDRILEEEVHESRQQRGSRLRP